MFFMKILYDDNCIVVCVKDLGVLSEAGGMPELLRACTGANEIFCVHRLDRVVGGVMVYAKTAVAAAKLSSAISGRQFAKKYLAVVEGEVPESGTYCDLLFHDARKNKTFVVNRARKGVKEAILDFRRLGHENGLSLVCITLHTGRSHQIRVQFASRKTPLAGDGKYGAVRREPPLALWSFSLSFPHPVTGQLMSFSQSPPSETPWNLFDTNAYNEQT